jgi:hypothetical protein
MSKLKTDRSHADNVRVSGKGISSPQRGSTRKQQQKGEEGVTKSGTRVQPRDRSIPLSGQDDQALKLLRSFARESRQTVRKPIRLKFGNRYVSPSSD